MATTQSQLVFTASDQTGAAFKSVENRMRGVGQSSAGLSQQIAGSLGRTVTGAASAALSLETLRQAFMQNAEFERDVLRVAQNAGRSVTANTAQIRESILSTSQATNTARTDITELFTGLVRGGMSVDQARGALLRGAQAMKVFGTSGTETGQALGMISRQFNVTTDQALEIISRSGKAADIFRSMPKIGEIAADIGERGEAGLSKLIARIAVVANDMGDVEKATDAAASAMTLMRSAGFKENIGKWAGVDVNAQIARDAKNGVDEFDSVARVLKRAGTELAATRREDMDRTKVTVDQLTAAMQELVGDRATAQLFRIITQHRGDVKKMEGELRDASSGVSAFNSKLEETNKLGIEAWKEVGARAELVKNAAGELLTTAGAPAFLVEMAERLKTTAEEIGGIQRLFITLQEGLTPEKVKEWWGEWKTKVTTDYLKTLTDQIDGLIGMLNPRAVAAFWSAFGDNAIAINALDQIKQRAAEAFTALTTGMKPGNDVEIALEKIRNLLDPAVVEKFWAAFNNKDQAKQTEESVAHLNRLFGKPDEALRELPGVPDVPPPVVPRTGAPATPAVPAAPAAPSAPAEPAARVAPGAARGPDAPNKEQTQQHILDESRTTRGLWERFIDVFARSQLIQRGNDENFAEAQGAAMQGGAGAGGGAAAGGTGSAGGAAAGGAGGGVASGGVASAGGAAGGAIVPTGGRGSRGGHAGAPNVRYGGQTAVQAGGGQGPGAGGVGRTPAGGGPGPTTTAGRSNVDSWMNMLTKPVAEGGLGFTREQAAGQVASLMGESGPNLEGAGRTWSDPSGSGAPGTSGGVASWRNERLRGLQAFAKERGLDWHSHEAQQGWYRQEMLHGDQRRTYEQLKTAKTAQEALSTHVRRFEAPAKPDAAIAQRSAYLNRLTRSDRGTAGPAAGAAAGDQAGGGALTMPTTSGVMSGGAGGQFGAARGGGTAPGVGGPRHHMGQDFRGAVGEPVKAVGAGVVESVRGSSVTVRHADGSSTTYRHTRPGVEVGQNVAAGENIATIGPRERGSTAPHLHLERRNAAGEAYDPRQDFIRRPEAAAGPRPEAAAGPRPEAAARGVSGADEIARMRAEAQKPIPIRFEGNMPAIRDRGALQARREMNNEMRQARSSTFSDVGVA